MDSHPLAITSPAVLVSEQEAHVASGSMYSVRYGCVVCRRVTAVAVYGRRRIIVDVVVSWLAHILG